MQAFRKYDVFVFFAAVHAFHLLLIWLSEEGVIRTTFFELAFLFLPPAAMLAAWLSRGRAGLRELLRTALKVRIHWGWYLFAIFLFPVVGLFSILISAALFDTPLKLDWYDITNGDLRTFTTITLISVGDELAWFSFGFSRLRESFNAAKTSLIIGIVWFLWYWPRLYFSDMVADPSIPVPLFCLHFLTLAPLCGWLYQSTKSGVLLVLTQVVGNYAFLVMPVLPQAAGSYMPFAVKVFVMATSTAVLVLLYGKQLSYRRAGDIAH